MISLRRASFVGAVVVAIGLAGLGAVALQHDQRTRLAGADLIGGGGEQSLRPLSFGSRSQGVTLDEVRLEGATLLAGEADGSLLLMTEGTDAAVVRSHADGRIIDVGFAAPLPGLTVESPHATADLALGPEGRAAMALAGGEVQILTFGWNNIQGLNAGHSPGAVAFMDDDTVLVGSAEGGRIDAVSVNDTTRHLLGPPDDPVAEVHWQEPPGRIVALVPLPDERVVFVGDGPDGFRLYLLSDSVVRPIETDGPNPVRGIEGARPEPGYRLDRLPMEPLAPAPDGRLVTIGLGRDGDPRISLVDVDSGEVDALAELDGIEPTIEQPVSATAVGDDLVFLADGRIWRMDGALTG